MIDVPGYLFVVLVAAGIAFLVRMDRNPCLDFRLVQFVSDARGQANSWALSRVTGLITSTWAVWYETMHGRLSEWLVLAYLGAVFAASVWNAATVARERTAALTKDRPVSESPETKTTTVTETK